MRNLILIISLFSGVCLFADSQRFVYFTPATQTIAIYRESDSGFRRSFSLNVSALESPQQATVAASLGWLQAQLAEGETLTLVVFEPYTIPDNPATAEVDESGLGLRAAITGRRDGGGERTPPAIDSKDVPEEVRDGLILLWNELAALPIPTPTPAPQPSPTPEP